MVRRGARPPSSAPVWAADLVNGARTNDGRQPWTEACENRRKSIDLQAVGEPTSLLDVKSPARFIHMRRICHAITCALCWRAIARRLILGLVGCIAPPGPRIGAPVRGSVASLPDTGGAV